MPWRAFLDVLLRFTDFFMYLCRVKKEAKMKCPYCHNEIEDDATRCPYCGKQLNQGQASGEPELSRGMKIFIAIGTVFLVAFGIMYYFAHRNDPDYFRTQIEPDSNLVVKPVIPVDTTSSDTLSKDSIDKEENEKAARLMNSVRKHRSGGSRQAGPASDQTEEQSSTEENGASGTTGTENGASSSAPAAPQVSKPKVESIEQ